MTETFTLTVRFNNQEQDYEAVLQTFGYTHRIVVTAEGVAITFEPDEERNYRAVVYDQHEEKKRLSPALVEAIATALSLALGRD